MQKNEMERIKQKIVENSIEVVSFDVFDTLLVRPFMEPTDLFIFLDKEVSSLIDSHDVACFSTIRKEAETEARRIAAILDIPDVTLDEIYQQIAELHIFPNYIVSLLMEKEKEFELRFCQARKSALELVEFAKNNHKRIIAVSDMYLPADFIRLLLESKGISGIDKVFVSCEVKATKASGKLYHYVENELGISGKAIVHFGDNFQADVSMARKCGWNAFHFYKPMDMFQNNISGRFHGNIFKHAFSDMRGFITDIQAMEYLGLRCMIAVAANIAFDNPYRKRAAGGDYAKDPMLFGTIPLGMYIVAQGLWIAMLARQKLPENVLFYSRDGYLPFLVYQLLQNHFSNLPASYYVRTSRKALLPFILANKQRVYTAGNHIRCDSHSPYTITKIMGSVLQNRAVPELEKEYGKKWNEIFHTEGQAIQFLQKLCEQYVDQKKMGEYESGFRKYFSKYIKSNILTYDIGYNLRNETILRYFFPETKICAAITHIDNNTPLLRSMQGAIEIQSFYPATPYITWLVRERFVSEQGPSCIGYSAEGDPVLESSEDKNETIDEIQKYAIEYSEKFISIFKKDITWLPIRLSDACQPMEAFLHSPMNADRKWFSQIAMEDDVTGLKGLSFTKLWRILRADYISSKMCLGKRSRKVMRLYMMLLYDRQDLQKKIKEKLRLSQ